MVFIGFNRFCFVGAYVAFLGTRLGAFRCLVFYLFIVFFGGILVALLVQCVFEVFLTRVRVHECFEGFELFWTKRVYPLA